MYQFKSLITKIFSSISFYLTLLTFLFIQFSISAVSSKTSTTSASTKLIEIKNIYSQYKKTKIHFYTTKMDKINFKNQLTLYINSLNSSLDKIRTLESLSNEDLLTPEGNQLAFDQELLKPLQALALTNFDKKACTDAFHSNKYNTGEDKKNYELVDSLIKQVCK